MRPGHRYANLETNHLLPCLGYCRGSAMVATNERNHIDSTLVSSNNRDVDCR